jgi:hypothetical protein
MDGAPLAPVAVVADVVAPTPAIAAGNNTPSSKPSVNLSKIAYCGPALAAIGNKRVVIPVSTREIGRIVRYPPPSFCCCGLCR